MANRRPTEDSPSEHKLRLLTWTPSRGFLIGMSTVVLFSLVLVAAGALASGQEAAPGAPEGPTPTVEPARVSYAPKPKAPRDDMAQEVAPVPIAQTSIVSAASPSETTEEAPVALSAASASPTPVASSWSATPVFDPPAPAPALTPAALALAQETGSRFGIDIVTDGQDWGTAEAEQTANISAVASAMEMLPLRVTSSVVSSPRGTLSVLSNREGRTLDGWKPYGGSERSFYTNSDQGPGGYRAANEIVLSTGSGPMTVAHEMIHGWTFRGVAPDEYVLALLGDEMRSFMTATGWRQLTGDDEVRAVAREPWEKVNAMFAYTGPELAFVDENGVSATFQASNPLEAIASLGAIYYARPAAMPLPAWAEIWAWFDANLG